MTEQIDKKIQDLENQIEKLKVENKRKDELPIEMRVAEFLHEHLCHYDHVEACGWDYHKWIDLPKLSTYSSKREYLRKATSLLKQFNEMQINDFILRLKEKIK